MAASLNLSISKIFPSIRRTLQYIEWILLTVHAVNVLLDRIFYQGINANALPGGNYGEFVALAICAGLSFVCPWEGSRWQQRAYIAMEILCLVVARYITVWNIWGGWDLLLYLILAKSCFLLPYKDTIVTTIATGVAWQISYALTIPIAIELMRTNNALDILAEDLSDPRRMIVSGIAGSITTYLAFSTFILLLCFLVLAEQRSRQKAIALAAEVEILATDLERTRIARDIHDSLGHTLTTLNVQLEVAQTLHSKNPDRSLQALNTAKSLANQSLQEVRQALSTMREENFDLNAALKHSIEQINYNNRFIIDVRTDLPKLPLQVSQQIHLIIKEGLVNIQKHSQASSIKLWTQSTSETITLGLWDNGVGFNPLMPNSGFGLRGMQERVKLLEGQIKIHSTPEKGTLIQVTIPR
ncbi:Signal transduction histidine kinase [Hyella patelloides LEGE 07179]|uniref:histidine kinase n=1 Tax=Hyella patelloides LEGE 07179 TaxID=945734 RepID=A0A563W228_9CYAN|nr:sensor histidine kinase [Hyella patelloides]VEP17695.1 Signal transduction histidine kinase [Hyella patelloides LEGE 07179]VEP17708.1 Signal transduction histidine kinase [Hyella patelloides LEGE 07179]